MEGELALRVRGLSLQAVPEPGRTLDFDLRRGEILAIMGGNGSGKSLLVSCLAGQRAAPGASVRVHGHELFDPRTRAAAQALLGVVFQHPGLLRTLPVFDNVALPFLQESLGLTGSLAGLVGLRLDMVGCGHLASSAPEALGEGDKRCVALARALSGTARVLLADEPASALATAARERVEELLSTLVRRGALDACVICTQDAGFALRVATRFAFLRDPDPATGGMGGFREERPADRIFESPVPPEIESFLSRQREWNIQRSP